MRLLILLSVFLGSTAVSWGQSSVEEVDRKYADSSEASRAAIFLKSGKDIFFKDRPLSMQFVQKALATANKPELNPIYADATNMMGIILMYNEKYDEAEHTLEQALALAKEHNYPVVRLKALMNLALNSTKKGDFQKSIAQNLEVIPLLEKGTDKLAVANAYANLSNAYSYLQQFQISNKYQLKAMEIFKELNYTRGIANAANTLGSNYKDLHDYPKSISYLKQALALRNPDEDDGSYGNLSLNIASLYSNLKDSVQELVWLKKAEAYFLKHHNIQGLTKTYTNYGVFYASIHDYKRAKEYEEKALAIGGKSKDFYTTSTLYDNLAKDYAQMHDSSRAYQYSRKAILTKDSLIDADFQHRIAEMQTKYETLKKEEQLKEQQFDITRKNYMLTGSLGLLLMGGALGYSSYRRMRLKAESRMQSAILRQQEESTRAVLEAEETERSRIAKDLHDGVGQVLSAAKMNLSAYEHEVNFKSPEDKLAFERIIHLVDESCKEVRAVSHNMMPNALLKNSLAAAIREFINQLDQRQLKVHLYTEGLDQRLDANTETVLYRVIQECVNNVIKHAKANTLDISVVKEASEITATIEDNGQGFNPASNDNTEGIGLKNIRTRVGYLKGTVDFDSTPGRGTVVAIHVPLASR